jgi:thioredoxin 1
MTLEIKDNEFENNVINSKGVVLVDFWAPWCNPCKVLGPILEDLSKDIGDQVKIMKMNIDDNPHTPTQYAVRGIPTMMLFKDGKHMDTKVGLVSKDVLSDWITRFV